MRPNPIALLVAFVSLVCCVSIAFAWWPLTHGLLGVDSGLNISPGYHQAPDTWPSYDSNNPFLGILDEFCWSHVTPRTGKYYVVPPWYYAYTPKYQDNDPAEHMRILIQKLNEYHRVLPKMEEFRKGYAAHNAEDQAGPDGKHTHFDLAPGADSWYNLARWPLHKDVENAVESVAYVDICYGGDANVAFDSNGVAVGFPNSPVDYTVMVNSSAGDADTDGLLCLAMKAFRKKQQTVQTDAMKGLTPLSRSEIGQKRIKHIDMSSQSLLNFTCSKWVVDRRRLFGDPNYPEEDPNRLPIWHEAPLWRQYYDAAKQAASGVQ